MYFKLQPLLIESQFIGVSCVSVMDAWKPRFMMLHCPYSHPAKPRANKCISFDVNNVNFEGGVLFSELYISSGLISLLFCVFVGAP